MDEINNHIDQAKEDICNSCEESGGSAVEYEGMSEGKKALIRALPLIITLVCVGLFAVGIKWVAGIFYAPHDSVVSREADGRELSIVNCGQRSSNTYYVYGEDYSFSAEELDNVGSEHTDAHHRIKPLVYFTLNEDPLDTQSMDFGVLIDSNGLFAMQIDEFVVYRLEGEYGVFAPLREFKQSATSRRNDLYVVKQLIKNDRYKGFRLPENITHDKLLSLLEKLEWQLDSEYTEDKQ